MIQTVKGALKTNFTENILIHEHICCVSNDMLHAFGDRWLKREDLINHSAKILRDMKEKYGLGLLVDGTPLDLGRNAEMLLEISMRSDVEILASCGLYIYPSMITMSNTEEELAELFLEEATHGLDNTSIKPGILKCATDNYGITEENERRIGALGRVQAKSGLPIYVHTLHQENTAIKALNILTERGADRNKIIMGHLDDECSYEYITNLLKEGCYVSFDRRHYTEKYTQIVAKMLVQLCEKGYSDRLLISNDTCIYSDFCSKGNKWLKPSEAKNTLGYVFEDLQKEFYKYGGDESLYKRILTQNALKILDV